MFQLSLVGQGLRGVSMSAFSRPPTQKNRAPWNLQQKAVWLRRTGKGPSWATWEVEHWGVPRRENSQNYEFSCVCTPLLAASMKLWTLIASGFICHPPPRANRKAFHVVQVGSGQMAQMRCYSSGSDFGLNPKSVVTAEYFETWSNQRWWDFQVPSILGELCANSLQVAWKKNGFQHIFPQIHGNIDFSGGLWAPILVPPQNCWPCGPGLQAARVHKGRVILVNLENVKEELIGANLGAWQELDVLRSVNLPMGKVVKPINRRWQSPDLEGVYKRFLVNLGGWYIIRFTTYCFVLM